MTPTEVLREARLWLNGQPDRARCKFATLNALLSAIDAALPNEEGWEEWHGGVEGPDVHVPIDVRFRNGEVRLGTRVLGWRWTDTDYPYDIVAYRVQP